VPHTHADVFALQGFGEARADAVERQREKAAAEQLGKPAPRLDRWELKREQAEREAAKETTPATQADVSKLSQSITSLANKVGLMGGAGRSSGSRRTSTRAPTVTAASASVTAAASSAVRTNGRAPEPGVVGRRC
jgi:hypothetical protein